MKFSISFSLKAFLIAVGAFSILFSTQISLAAGYYSNTIPPCYDVTGTSTTVLVGGVANSGIMNFDQPAAELAPQYAACVLMSGGSPSNPVRVKGWVWDDNLGWISFYCGDEDANAATPRTNLGIACGNVDYGVTMATTGTGPDYTTVTMDGYAWGDNLGWMQFNSGFHQLSPTASGANRGLVEGSLAAGRKFAWTDSVGWFDFTGVRFPWENLDPADKVEVCTYKDRITDADGDCDCNLATGCVPTTDIPTADNTPGGGWIINVVPDDGGTVPSANLDTTTCAGTFNINSTTGPGGGKTHALCIWISWNDTVSTSQTDRASQTYDCSTNTIASQTCAVTKPVGAVASYGGLALGTIQADGYGSTIRSLAPTSDKNVSSDGMQFEKFYYFPSSGFSEGVVGTNYDVTSINNNLLNLSSLQILFFEFKNGVTPGQCIFGNLNAVTGACSAKTYVSGQNLSFKPWIIVNKLDQYVNSTKTLNFLDLLYGSTTRIDYQVTNNGSGTPTSLGTSLYAGLGNSVTQYLLNIVDATFQAISQPLLLSVGTSSTYLSLGVVDPENPPTSSPADDKPYMYSSVAYTNGGFTVRYFSNKLPRIKAGILKNPVAKVAGNIYGTGLTNKASDISISSIGNVASNLKREQVLRNLSKFNYAGSPYLTGLTPGNTTINLNIPADFPINTKEFQPGIYYVKDGNLTIDCGASDCTPAGNYTFVVENGSIIVKSNIKPATNIQLGLIALRNYAVEDYSDGNLMVWPNVTDMWNTHVYLDRLMMSCNDTCALSGGTTANSGWPIFSDDYQRQEILKNQFRFTGTISSLNGFGNATATIKTDEFGVTIPPSTVSAYAGASSAPTGLARARTVDLNFLRYYGPGLQICDATNATNSGEMQNVAKDQQGTETDDCDPTDAAYLIDANQLAPVGDLVVGATAAGAIKSAKYTGQTSLDSEFPVYFEYVPINASLWGFEVDEALNQTEVQ